ncbi:hypothetical protein D9M72_615210 [compost metagenome]
MIEFTGQNRLQTFSLFSGRDVLGYFRGADRLSAAVIYRRNAELDVDKTTILSSTLRFVGLYDIPGADLSQDFRLLVVPLLRHKHQNGLSDRLVSRISVEVFGGGVPVCDRHAEIDTEDRIVRGLDDSS